MFELHLRNISQEVTNQAGWRSDYRIKLIESLRPNLVHRFCEDDSDLRTVFEVIEYNEQAKKESGLQGLVRILGVYQRDKDLPPHQADYEA